MKEIIKNLPQAPGIYKFKDKEGHIIYVGKAKNLRKRVQSYFRKDYSHSTRTEHLLKAASDLEFTQTDSELEAIILENNLIKELRPRYNILMKDDKSYVYIKIDLKEDFPTVQVIRERNIPKNNFSDKASRYFGPKLASGKVYETLRVLKKLFPFRHCRLDIKFNGEKEANGERYENLGISPDKALVEVKNKVIDYPCLDYFIKRCPGPCIGAISPSSYKKVVQQIADFLDGKSDELENSIKNEMTAAASQKLFEKAARLRDKLIALESIIERQKITDHDRQDTDVINFITDVGRVYFNIFMIRNGKLTNQENFTLDAAEMTNDVAADASEILEALLTQYYEKAAYIPKEIFIPSMPENAETIEKWLSKERGDRVYILNPKKGEKNKLLELSAKNAESFSKQYRLKWLAEQNQKEALSRLAEVLGMKEKPLKRIEGFDISHIGGQDTVGSMVAFVNGNPKPEHYRHFKIRTLKGKPDDYRSMEEVLMRRFKFLAHGAAKFTLKNPSKKLFEQIKKILKKEKLDLSELDQKTFFCLFKEKEFIGFARIPARSEIAGEIRSLWISQKHRGNKYGYELIKRIMQKSKFKKIYVYIKPAMDAPFRRSNPVASPRLGLLENYYAEFGFKTVKEIPEIFKKRVAEAAASCYGCGILMVMEKHSLSYGDPSFKEKPDLIVIDGGKGQLETAILVLKRLRLEIPAISLAKKLEEIYLPDEKAPLLLSEGDEALKLLQRIRDESHRFAITFHRDLHRKRFK